MLTSGPLCAFLCRPNAQAHSPSFSLSHPHILIQYGHVWPMNRRLCSGHEWMGTTESEKGGEEKKSSLCSESCSDEINRCNGLVQMEYRRGQGELGKKMKTITLLHPPRGFWEKVRGCRGWARFISEALLALKFWALVPAFIAPDLRSHNPCSPSPYPFFSFLYLKVSQSWAHACMDNFLLTLHIALQEWVYVCTWFLYVCMCECRCSVKCPQLHQVYIASATRACQTECPCLRHASQAEQRSKL